MLEKNIFQIIDTLDDFFRIWEKIKGLNPKTQLENWQFKYMNKWPDLFIKLIKNYEKEGYNWKKIAKNYVFRNLDDRVPAMSNIREILREFIPKIVSKASKNLGLDFKINFVLYVGIGIGAGWATEFRNKPSVLFGLENIVECGWFSRESLAALTAHEVGHLIHQNWRNKEKLPNQPNQPNQNKSPFWQLYEEGFAMRCEHLITGYNSWHESEGQLKWLEWCILNKSLLAQKFLEMHNNSDFKKHFFGSWFDIEGQKQTGYFLGHEILKAWENNESMTLKEIALLNLKLIDRKVRNSLNNMIKKEI